MEIKFVDSEYCLLKKTLKKSSVEKELTIPIETAFFNFLQFFSLF